VSADDARPSRPAAGWRAAAGLVAAATAVGVGHGAAGLLDPAASPLVAVGAALIDAAPTPLKTFAIRTFGTADKPVLIAGVATVLAVLAAGLGLVAWRRRGYALVGIGLLGAVGAVAAGTRGTLLDTVPALVAVGTGVATLGWLTRVGRRRPAGRGGESETSRRRLLAGLAGAGTVAAVGGLGGVLAGRGRTRAAAAGRAVRLPVPVSPAASVPVGAQLPGMTPFLTPADSFYRVDIALVTPRVDVSDWTLRIDGMVDRPLTLTYDELLALPMVERAITLACVSNEVGGPYVSTATWLGVPFAEIIEHVGVQPGVDQVFSSSLDSGFTCSTPYAAVDDGRDAMVVVGMNGQVLPDARGYPARMLVPGLFGFVSATKWLKRIEFTSYAARTAYWTTRGWATDAPVLTQARIDRPKSLGTLPRDRPMLAGVAWAQHRGIARVEIRIDGGPWREARLAADAGKDLWRQWSFAYDGQPGRHRAQVRATDATGAVQPERRTKVFPSGAQGWQEIQFEVA